MRSETVNVADSPTRRLSTTAPVDPARLAAARAAIHQGRVHARANAHADALSAFEEALTILPEDGRVLCEAGFVAHNAGDHARADVLLTHGLARLDATVLAPDTLRRARAMCLYNAGLVFSARGDHARARDAYTESLSLRDNRVVRQHLSALNAGTRGADEQVASNRNALRDAYADQRAHSLSELYNRLGRIYARRRAEDDFDGDALDCVGRTRDSDEQLLADTSAAGMAPARAAVLRIGCSEQEDFVAVFETDSGWVAAGAVASLFNPGAAGIYNEIEIRSAELHTLSPDGTRALAVVVHSDSHDSDMGINEEESSTENTLVICSATLRAECSVRVLLEAHYERALIDDTPDSELGISAGDHTPGLPIRSDFVQRYQIADGRIVIAPEIENPRIASLSGSYTLASLASALRAR